MKTSTSTYVVVLEIHTKYAEPFTKNGQDVFHKWDNHMCAPVRVKYITPSHYHHWANFIWRKRTYKMPVRYSLSTVWVRLSIFSQLSIIQYVGLCVFSLPISFVMIERIYIFCLIIIIKSEVWTITHCLGLGYETRVCAVCLSIFLLKNIIKIDQYQTPTEHKTVCIITEMYCTYVGEIGNSVWTGVANYLCAHERISLVFISRFA